VIHLECARIHLYIRACIERNIYICAHRAYLSKVKCRVLAIALLDSFYTNDPRHHGTLAPLWWHPGDSSVSSRNLRKMLPQDGGSSSWDLLCINSCPYIVQSANHHGRPEPMYVAELLRRLEPFDCLLVCGSIAKNTFRLSPYKGSHPVLFIHHPAWRAWSTVLINEVREAIASVSAGALSGL
jgi:hypothetical protein